MWHWRSPWPLGSRARSMHIFSLLFDLSIHTSVNSWLSHFKFSIVVVEKRNFRLKRYYVINIFKLEYLRYLLSAWDQTYFGKSRMTMTFISKKKLFYVTSGLAYMTSLNFQLRISLLFLVRLHHNLVREILVVHMTLRSYKISYDLEGHLDIWVQLKG